jgi:lysophospholipase-2
MVYYCLVAVQTYISDEEKKGIPRNRIMVGGFSQGGAVAFYSALTQDKPPLAGIIGLSTWLPMATTFPEVS